MARLTAANEAIAHEIIGRYPVRKSALVPLLHLAQEQDGYVTEDALEHLAELIGCTPAEVLGTCSFYEMLKLEEVGRFVVNVCTDISCMLLGADQLLHHAEQKLGVGSGQTTLDGQDRKSTRLNSSHVKISYAVFCLKKKKKKEKNYILQQKKNTQEKKLKRQ